MSTSTLEAAVRELLVAINETLHGVEGRDDSSRDRISVLKVYLENLVDNLIIDEQFPELPQAPKRDVLHIAEGIRERLSELKRQEAARTVTA